MGKKWKLLLAVLIIVAATTASCCAILNSDWFQRHYGYYGDCIQIYAYEDGRLMETQEYEINLLEGWFYEKHGNPFSKNRWSYSLGGEYGTFCFTLKWQGREAEFFLENVNDWWRTDINLYINTHQDVIQQTNIVWNNNPAFADAFELEWKETTDE